MELTEQQIMEKIRQEHPEVYNEQKSEYRTKVQNTEQDEIKKDKLSSMKYIPKTQENRKAIMQRLKKDAPKLYNEYNKENLFSDPIKPEVTKLSEKMMDLVERTLGAYGSERLQINLVYLIEACDLIIPLVGEEWLIEQYLKKGKSWADEKIKLASMRKKLMKMKVFYDHLENLRHEPIKKIKTTQSEIKRCFQKYIRRIAMMQPDLYFLFVLLCENTTLKSRKIPSDYFKILDHRDSNAQLIGKKKRPFIPSPTRNEQETGIVEVENKESGVGI